VAQAIARFGPTVRIAAAAIANLNGEASPPCGACRQVMAEFIEPGAPVVFPLANGVRVMAFCDLMPLACEMKFK
jgi:cytidine deaminase